MDTLSKMLTTEERTWAVFSHLSALALGMGILLPVIGWSEQRRKSNYASFQSLQALGYQSMGYTIWFLSYLLLMIILLIIMIPVLGSTGEDGRGADAIAGVWMTIFFVLMFGFLGIYLLLPIIAAIACALGRNFHYPAIGNRLARYLGYDSAAESEWLIEEHEDRWVAAMGHFSVIIPLWGMLAPLTAWILHGKRSFFLKFQSIQTLIYQAGVLLLSFISGFLYLFGMVVFLGLTFGARGNNDSPMTIIGFVVLFASILIVILLVLAIPLFHILGQWAGYRVLKGDNYHYPLLGKLAEHWVLKNTISVAEEKLA
jgi:uncharacterized Tic20 family protein